MTDIDAAMRRLSDLESQVREQGYRIKALEKAKPNAADPWADVSVGKNVAGFIGLPNGKVQFCPCGRDVCRAPDCPSHKTDPLGR